VHSFEIKQKAELAGTYCGFLELEVAIMVLSRGKESPDHVLCVALFAEK
jgi:hypothetical protein